MGKLGIIAAIAAQAVFSPALAANKLPFPDGSYASDPKYCKMSRQQAYNLYEFAFYDIRGRSVSNYETICTIRNVKVVGNSVRFKMFCEVEGEPDVSNEIWQKLGPTKFRAGDHVWTGCGKFVN